MENKKAEVTDVSWDNLMVMTEQHQNGFFQTDILEAFELEEVVTMQHGYKRKFNETVSSNQITPNVYNNDNLFKRSKNK